MCQKTRNRSFEMISDWFIYFRVFLDRENRYNNNSIRDFITYNFSYAKKSVQQDLSFLKTTVN